MKSVTKTRDELRVAINNIMDFDTEALLDRVTDGICSGKSVLVDGLSYAGNGKYAKKTRDRYRYKLIVPIMDKNGNLYSTDLFQNKPQWAINGHYGIYYKTRQLVVDVIEDFETDYRNVRFEHGYKEESGRYGQFKVVTELAEKMDQFPTREELARFAKKKRGEQSMREVAKQIGISVSTYSRIENKKSCTVETLYHVRNWINGTA